MRLIIGVVPSYDVSLSQGFVTYNNTINRTNHNNNHNNTHLSTLNNIDNYIQIGTNSLRELQQEEQRVMDTYPVIVNKQSAYLTDEERIAKDKERNKLYRESHKEEIAEINKKWYKENREYVLMKCRKWTETHKEETAARRSQRYLCGCGVESSYLHKSRHEKTAFHLQNISK